VIKQAKAGEATFRVDSGKNIHVPVGKISFSESQLIENMASIMKALSDKKPATSKGKYMRDAFLKTTMGPRWGVNIEGIDPRSKHYLLNIK
jgi:large subunit ribosomal protein L1